MWWVSAQRQKGVDAVIGHAAVGTSRCSCAAAIVSGTVCFSVSLLACFLLRILQVGSSRTFTRYLDSVL